MEALGLLIKSCDCHVLKVYDAWLPYEENEAMQLENEASILDSKRSDICVLFRGQKIRSHHSLWAIFLNCKEKKLYPSLNLLHPFCWNQFRGRCLRGRISGNIFLIDVFHSMDVC